MAASVDIYLAADPRSALAPAFPAPDDATADTAGPSCAPVVTDAAPRADTDRRVQRAPSAGGLPIDRMVSESIFDALVDSGSLALATFDDGSIHFASPAFLRLLGLSSLQGETATSWCRRLHGADRARVAGQLHDAMAHGKALATECLITQPGGEAIKAHLAGYPAGPLSRAVFTLLLHVDVQSRAAAPEPRLPGAVRRAFAVARSDVLDRASDLLVDAWLTSETLAVLAVGLHAAGPDADAPAAPLVDATLLACLRNELRDGDAIGHYGDNGILIAIPNLSGPCSAGIVAGRLIDAVARSWLADGAQVQPAVNIGIALFPVDDQELSGLLAHAGAALEFARQQGANRYSLAETSLNRTLQRPAEPLHAVPKVGLAELDMHHGLLIEALEAAAQDAAGGTDPAAMQAGIERVRQALVAGFAAEEAIMRANPAEASNAHRREHERALRNIDFLLRAAGHQGAALAMAFVHQWLADHVAEFDAPLVVTTYRPLW